MLIVIIAGIGLVINAIGMLIFGHDSHGHGHGHSHSHSHSSSDHSSKEPLVLDARRKSVLNSEEHEEKLNREKEVISTKLSTSSTTTSLSSTSLTIKEEPTIVVVGEENNDSISGNQKYVRKKRNVNIHGIFLHMLGDTLGSIGAMASGLGIWLLPWNAKYFLDPICSDLITIIIFTTSFSLVRRCIKILMQSVPEHIDLDRIAKELLQINGILSIHELHIWHLADTKVIGTVHLTCPQEIDFFDLAVKVKRLLHSYGVHSTTIQPEFVIVEKTNVDYCTIPCGPKCSADLCCSPRFVNQTKPNELDPDGPSSKTQDSSTVSEIRKLQVKKPPNE